MENNNKYSGLEIAIIGMSGSFPGSLNCNDYWENLKQGKELTKEFKVDELEKMGLSSTQINDENYVKRVGVLEDKDRFDNAFFGYRPEEAFLMDPQIRLFHEHCWKALEDSGYSNVTDSLKIGVFAGAAENSNWRLYAYGKSKEASIDPFYLEKISNQNFMSTLVSYSLNLRGPAISIATACSTSLVAVDQACKNLLTRSCSIALAGGSSVNTLIQKGYYYKEGQVNSKDGHCCAFDAGSSGTAQGEGVGVVVLKRLSEAIKDNDNIYAIIKSSCTNNDGTAKVGYTAPSVSGQSDCIKMAHKLAGVDKRTISYIETHGTGTRLGDPIEIRALNKAFDFDAEKKYCAIGSVKTNIGHLDAAAGVASLIKVALSLKYKLIPASINFKKANPEINFDEGPFFVNTQLRQWDSDKTPRRAGVSAFGIGGTNAHIVLEEAPEKYQKGIIPTGYNLLTLSAKSKTALSQYCYNLKEYIQANPTINISDLVFTLNTTRAVFQYKSCLVFKEQNELLDLLSQRVKDHPEKSSETSEVVFMFSGAGSQYVNMGKDLYEHIPYFKNELDDAFRKLKAITGYDYNRIFFSDGNSEEINNMLHTQPCIFAFGHSLAKLLIHFGVQPKYLIGHSVGEYIAACISEVFSFEDALKLVVVRGRLMNTLPAGGMISVSLSEQKSRSYLNERISLAAINGPDQVVLSGDESSLKTVMNKLDKENVDYVKLHATQAGHSHLIEEIMEEYSKVINEVKKMPPAIPFISNLTGKPIQAEEAVSSEYWVNHMRHTVRFSEGLDYLEKGSRKIFIEMGGGHSLITLLKQHRFPNISAINLVRHPKDNINDYKYFLIKMGAIWSKGIKLSWRNYFDEKAHQKISLPTYCFDNIRFPAEVNPFAQENSVNQKSERKESIKDWIYYPVWKSLVTYGKHIKTNVEILAFSNDDVVSDIIKEICLERAYSLIEVVKGIDFEKIAEKKYRINPLVPEHMDMLVEDLNKNKLLYNQVIYTWATSPNIAEIEMAKDNLAINVNYFTPVNFIKAVLKQDSLNKSNLLLVTNKAHLITGKNSGAVSQSLLFGCQAVLPQESSMSCTNLDIDTTEETILIRNSFTEIIDAPKIYNNSTIVHRNGKIWKKEFERNEISIIKSQKIKHRGTYLITGGLGKFGCVIAEYFLKKYDANLILIGRSSVEQDKEKRIKLNELISLSGKVEYIKCDVADANVFNEVVEKIYSTYGSINGVIHTAGVIDMNQYELMEDITYKNALELLSPKVKGINNIYHSFKEKKVDFVVVTSSLASVLGGLGFCSYSAANLYMDHFVQSNGLSNWRSLQLSEMAFSKEEIEKEESPQRSAIKPNEIAELLEWSLNINQPLLAVTVFSLADRLDKLSKVSNASKQFNDLQFAKSERPELENEYQKPITETEKKLASMFEDFFGIERIGTDDNFFELGGDSLKAMMVLKKIKAIYNITLSIKDIFAKPNIRLLSIEIDGKLIPEKNKNKSRTII